MILYDVAIIGAGPAGIACSIVLSKAGKKCLIIEKRKDLKGKVCGDGLTVRALRSLEKINVNPLELEGKKVFYKKIVTSGKTTTEKFLDLFNFEYEYGVSRDLLDEYMLSVSSKLGTNVLFEENCREIKKVNDYHLINDKFCAKHVVLACGAIGKRALNIDIPNDLPVGMSARIIGECDYNDDSFYYFYDDRYGNGYAWIFPVGINKWNIGVWSSNKKNIRYLYNEFENYIFNNQPIEYDRTPKGAMIGASMHVHNSEEFACIGDCAYAADYKSGEGVSIAVENGIKTAYKILEKDLSQ